MELSQEIILKELSIYESKLCSAEIYRGTPEGILHAKEASVMRGCLLRLGLISEAQNSAMWKSAKSRAGKTGRNYDRN